MLFKCLPLFMPQYCVVLPVALPVPLSPSVLPFIPRPSLSPVGLGPDNIHIIKSLNRFFLKPTCVIHSSTTCENRPARHDKHIQGLSGLSWWTKTGQQTRLWDIRTSWKSKSIQWHSWRKRQWWNGRGSRNWNGWNSCGQQCISWVWQESHQNTWDQKQKNCQNWRKQQCAASPQWEQLGFSVLSKDTSACGQF